METRDSSREVVYESEVLEKTVPDTETIYTDASQPVGYCSVQSAHIGYKARLWKVVRENGEEVSREQVNSSSYMKAPRSATVGVATEDPGAYNADAAAAQATAQPAEGQPQPEGAPAQPETPPPPPAE